MMKASTRDILKRTNQPLDDVIFNQLNSTFILISNSILWTSGDQSAFPSWQTLWRECVCIKNHHSREPTARTRRKSWFSSSSSHFSLFSINSNEEQSFEWRNILIIWIALRERTRLQTYEKGIFTEKHLCTTIRRSRQITFKNTFKVYTRTRVRINNTVF